TDVITTCANPIAATASARRAGSAASNALGVPCETAQYAQFRVQTSPRIMKVAALWSQHSPMLGQRASSQTVCSPSSRISFLIRRYSAPPGALTLSHDGLRAGVSGSTTLPASDRSGADGVRVS